MTPILLVRFGELALKGKNRRSFLGILERNVKDCLAAESIAVERLSVQRQRILMAFPTETERQKALACLTRVFGISSLSRGETAAPDAEGIQHAVLEHASALRRGKGTSFRVSVQRLDKRFPLTSMELERSLGTAVKQATGWKVSLSQQDIEIGIELIPVGQGTMAAVFTEKSAGAGGLPVGTEGRALLIAEGSMERDVLAGWLCLKRGCALSVAALSGSAAKKDAEKVAEALRPFSHGAEVRVLPPVAPVDLSAALAGARATGVVSGSSPESYPGLSREIFVLAPLVGLAQDEIAARAARIMAGSLP